jgi:arylsulfatase A-like enzyme
MKKLLLSISILFNAVLYAQTQPNFIFVTFDDMNDWVQGFNGQPQSTTPNIQYLVKRGTTFTNAYCNAPQCGPSRTSMFTGKDNTYINVLHNTDLSCSDFRSNFSAAEGNETIYTLPEMLKDSGGYFTYSISKVMHCHDNNFDYDSLNPDVCNRELSWNKLLFFDYINGEQNVILDYGEANQMGVYAWPYSVIPDSLEPLMQDYIATDSAIAFIEDYASDPGKFCDKPFFLGLGFRRPHSPYYIPEKYFTSNYDDDYYSAGYNLPYNYPVGTAPANGFIMPPQPIDPYSDYDSLPLNGVARALIAENKVHLAAGSWAADQVDYYGIPPTMPGLTAEEQEFALAEAKRANMQMSYQASIKFVDAQLGRLIDELKTHPEIFNNTIFVVVSDHGYSLGEKTHWKKGCLWETDIRVPMVIADLRTPVKKTSKRFVTLLDLFPTVCDYAGVEYPTFPDGSDYLDGYSLIPLMENPLAPWSKPVLTSFKNTKDPGRQGSCFPQYSVRDEEWHYIRYQTNGDGFPVSCDEATSEIQEELYHIGKKKNIDPYEWNNLAEDPAYAAIKDDLASYLPGGVNYLQFAKATANNIVVEEEMIEINMFPNPANDMADIIISGMEGAIDILFYNTIGDLIFADDLIIAPEETGHYYVNVTNWPSGIYYATLDQNGKKASMQMVVQH